MSKKVKCIIAGSRSVKSYNTLLQAIEASGWAEDIKEVVCGMAYGVDELGFQWATENGIKIKEFPADWKNIKAEGAVIRENAYGKYNAAAGRVRNEAMAKYADVLIAVIKDNSPGTTHMIECMQKLGKDVYVWEI